MKILEKGLVYLTLAGTILSSACNKKSLEEKIEDKKIPKTEIKKDSISYGPKKIDSIDYELIEQQKDWKTYWDIGFNNYERITYERLGGNRKIAKEYAKRNLSSREIVLNLAAGIKPESVGKVKDTKKPNALLIYSKYDHNNAFISKPSLNMIKKISKNYDVSLSVCKNDEEVSQALDKVKNPDLIIFGGHGNGYAVTLSDSVNFEENQNRVVLNKGVGSKYAFDIRDKKIIKKLSEKGNATLVLPSCLNGRVLAPHIKKNAPNLKVVAPKKTVDLKNSRVYSSYPFDISFYDEKGEDCTYKE